MARRNPHAVALGRKGGTANTLAQREARARNGRNGGRPSLYRRHGDGPVERFDGEAWTIVEPLDAAARAWIRRERATWGHEAEGEA